jgi:hypothetical protein
MARMMVDEYSTPRCFWAEAINIACYISNQNSLRSLLNLTPFELSFGREPSISHLRPFGCKCFILKHGNLDKFESRSWDGIFLGYTPYGRSYKVINLETNTIVESCDVTLNETALAPVMSLKVQLTKRWGEYLCRWGSTKLRGWRRWTYRSYINFITWVCSHFHTWRRWSSSCYLFLSRSTIIRDWGWDQHQEWIPIPHSKCTSTSADHR